MTKVDIVSGFLGAGKTTFIKRLIADVFQGEKIVLIENEFGEIGIDGGFLKNAGVEITEMNSGCICCTLVGDFSQALQKVIEEYHPDRVIIEPSGVGKLSDVAQAVEAVKETCPITINSRLTVVDAKKTRMFMKNFGEFFNNQIENATTIVLSRTQTLSEDRLQDAVNLIRDKNPSASLITTPWDELDGKAIAGAITPEKEVEELLREAAKMHDHTHEHGHCGCGCHHEDHEHSHDHHEHDHEECHHDHHNHHGHEHGENCTCGCHGHGHEEHHHADEVFQSWGRETAHKYDRTELEAFLTELSDSDQLGTVLRAKGILQLQDGTWIEFDLVPGEYEIRNSNPDYTGKICIIGTDLKTERFAAILQIA